MWDWIPEDEARMMARVFAAEDFRKSEKERLEAKAEEPEIPVLDTSFLELPQTEEERREFYGFYEEKVRNLYEKMGVTDELLKEQRATTPKVSLEAIEEIKEGARGGWTISLGDGWKDSLKDRRTELMAREVMTRFRSSARAWGESFPTCRKCEAIHKNRFEIPEHHDEVCAHRDGPIAHITEAGEPNPFPEYELRHAIQEELSQFIGQPLTDDIHRQIKASLLYRFRSLRSHSIRTECDPYRREVTVYYDGDLREFFPTNGFCVWGERTLPTSGSLDPED